MGRPPKVNKEEAKQMIRDGKSNAEIANYYKVTHQAITGLRKEVKQEKDEGAKLSREPIRPKRQNYTWSEIQEAILQTFQQAKTAEGVIDENWKLKNRVAILENALAELNEKIKSGQEYDLLVKRGDIPAPLIIRGDKRKLTKT